MYALNLQSRLCKCTCMCVIMCVIILMYWREMLHSGEKSYNRQCYVISREMSCSLYHTYARIAPLCPRFTNRNRCYTLILSYRPVYLHLQLLYCTLYVFYEFYFFIFFFFFFLSLSPCVENATHIYIIIRGCLDRALAYIFYATCTKKLCSSL